MCRIPSAADLVYSPATSGNVHMISRLVDYARARFERETRTYTYLDTYRQGRCWIETRTFDLFNMASSSEHFHCPFVWNAKVDKIDLFEYHRYYAYRR